MRKFRLGRAWVLLVVPLLSVLSPLSVSAASPAAPAAANGFNITTSPLPVELSTTPGKTITTGLRVQDSGTNPVKIKVSVLKFKAFGSDGRPQLLHRQPGDTFLDWVTFSQNNFVAQPGVWNNITMTIAPPKTAAFGYYYAVLFSQDTSGQSPTTPNTGKLNGATATLVLVDVQVPGEKRQVEITSFTSSKKLYEYLPANFNVAVHNSGQIFTAPTGNIFISRDHTHDIAVLGVNTSDGNVLPDFNRIFQSSWTDGFPVFVTERDHGQIVSDKHGNPVQQLQWNFAQANKLRFGHYYAHLLLVYNNGKQDVPLDAEVGFWVLPWKILPIILVIIIILAVGLWSSGRSVLRKARKKTGR